MNRSSVYVSDEELLSTEAQQPAKILDGHSQRASEERSHRVAAFRC